MSLQKEEIQSNFLKVKERIDACCRKAGKNSSEVTLVNVSKTMPVESIEAVYEMRGKDFGENKVQELSVKMDHFHSEKDIRWHQIGRLQTNKVKYLIGKNVLIHSVDRYELAKKISDLSVNAGTDTDILVQVNVSGEASKAGISLAETEDFMAVLSELDGIRVKGLMTIAPHMENTMEIRSIFSCLREIYLDIQRENKYNNRITMQYLSMGMSNDYEIAIEEGSNLVRVGRAIFGDR